MEAFHARYQYLAAARWQIERRHPDRSGQHRAYPLIVRIHLQHHGCVSRLVAKFHCDSYRNHFQHMLPDNHFAIALNQDHRAGLFNPVTPTRRPIHAAQRLRSRVRSQRRNFHDLVLQSTTSGKIYKTNLIEYSYRLSR